jgi:hypothetical protein
MRDTPIAHNVALSYRFKRAHLAQWREIGKVVGGLIAGFKTRPKEELAEPNRHNP